jgi:hypothetical protein
VQAYHKGAVEAEDELEEAAVCHVERRGMGEGKNGTADTG